MKNNSRREFLQKFLPENFKSNLNQKTSDEIMLGGIGEFPPEGETFFPVWELVLESLPEGIRVRSYASPTQYFEVELGRH